MLYVLKLYKKILIATIIIFFIIFILSRGHIYKKESLEYGLTFSKKQAQSLGFNWQEVYLSVLNDLRVKKIRLPAYWDEIEASDNQFEWADLDWQIKKAEEQNVSVILAVGGRLPRWPECHYPAWTKNLSEETREIKILSYINKTISRYKAYQNISAWQIENEPFLSHFGECPKLDKNFLDQEIALARQLDSRPIVVTDSGELSIWVGAAKRADIFGITMYRDTYSAVLKSYIHYPISPGFFRFKKNITRLFARPKKWLVIELQAEPWGPKPYQDLSQEDRDKTMNLEKFKEMTKFSAQTGFQEFYLWGVEWWYWELSQGRPETWNYAKSLFN
ncbi:hypothetical protein COV49_03810 [Candidatus Falkowbacteria bacterium CG11_big_fil_rev_8_21_14_0_20_39_10]|uniref:GH10 domain-containing protein n=1 Tax=Candidatus Falkowbacteria bacterium CG11_big_fil_rev_8_21_14_0_20_39_10 TaxID=1974570 RepID=A0A2M6K8E3_9BACT|nr:MAG: hypothetical protein COV49_03810 [Candidatus Falkowbacteria bacterium CG11_big_fil_rev_8_21_14_0_20_39_10]